MFIHLQALSKAAIRRTNELVHSASVALLCRLALLNGEHVLHDMADVNTVHSTQHIKR